jgi:hypothetical protein
MNHYTPGQWAVGLVGTLGYVRMVVGLWRDALFPDDNPKRYQRVIRMTSAIVFSIALLAAIPFWLGLYGNKS